MVERRELDAGLQTLAGSLYVAFALVRYADFALVLIAVVLDAVAVDVLVPCNAEPILS